MQIRLVFLTAAILAACVTAVPLMDRAMGRLQIIETSDNILEEIYFNDDTGIRIQADPKSLTLTSLADGKVLISAHRPHDDSLYNGKLVP